MEPAGDWFPNYIATYLERDVRQLLAVRDLSQLQRFVRSCAARTGQLLNLSALGTGAGLSHSMARQWLSLLEASYRAGGKLSGVPAASPSRQFWQAAGEVAEALLP